MSDKLQIVTEKDGSRWVPLESYVKSLREVLNAFPGNKQEYIPDQNIIDGGGYVIAGIVKDVFKELERKEDRIRELEAALAGQHEIVCAYCREVFPNDDPKVILEHIQSCDKRPEKAIFETLERMQNIYEKRILLLVNAAGRLVDMHLEDEDNAVWGETEIPVLEVPNQKMRDEAVKELRELLLEGPPNDEEEPKTE